MDPFTEAVIAAGAVVAALVVLSRAVLAVSKAVTSIQEAIGHDSEGKTLAERHEQTEQHLKIMDTRVSSIEAMLAPPGQRTLPARVDSVEREVDSLRIDVQKVGASVDTLTALIRDDRKGTK